MVDITQDDEHGLLSIQPPSTSIPLAQDVGDDVGSQVNQHQSDEEHHHGHTHHHHHHDVTLEHADSRQDQDQDQVQDHLIHDSLDIPTGPYSLSGLPQEQESSLPIPSHTNNGQAEDETASGHIQHIQLMPSSSSSTSAALNDPSGHLEHHQLSESSLSQSPQTVSRSRQPSQRMIHQQPQQTLQSRQSAGSDVTMPKRRYKARCKWSTQDKETLVRELVRQKDMGNQLGSGFLSESWMVVANLLAGSEDKSGGDPKGPDECKSAFSRLKREFIKVKQLKRSFAQWNEEDQRPEADPTTIKTFLAAHPTYAPYITGWPFFNSMEHINMGVTTLDASIAKPLATNPIGYSGAEMDKGEDSDGESDTSDMSSSRLTERRKRTSSNAGLVLTDPSATGSASNHASIGANGKQSAGGPGPSKRRNTTVIGDEATGGIGKESLSVVRHRARELLWKDVKEEGWSLTEQDIINVLGRFDENATYAETYADIPYFTLRLLYLQSITFPKLI